jgi:hypothetical protein
MMPLAGKQVPTLDIDPASLSVPCGCSFEDAAAALAELPRMYCEPDGSFVWVSEQGEPSWQIDGNLYDRDQRLLFVDLKGTCPAHRFDELLRTLGWPETPLVFQFVREAVFVDEAEFRRVAGLG